MLAVPKRAAAGTPEVAAGGGRGDLLPTHQHQLARGGRGQRPLRGPHNEAPANQALPLLVNGARAKRGVRQAAKTAGKPKT